MAKSEFSIYKNAFSTENVLLNLNQKRNMLISSTVYKQKQLKPLNKHIGGFSYEGTAEGGLFRWKKHYYGLWTGMFA